MAAATTPRPSRKTRPTAEQWEIHQAKIRDLYCTPGMTLKKTIQIMEEEDGFTPTERMIKARLPGWEVPRKKLDKSLYNAMWQVMRVLSSNTTLGPITFKTLTGTGEQSQSLRKIEKELERKSKVTDEKGWIKMSFTQALEILLHSEQVGVKAFAGNIEIDLSSLSSSAQGWDSLSSRQISPPARALSLSLPPSPLSESGTLSWTPITTDSQCRRRSYTPGSTFSLLAMSTVPTPSFYERCLRCPDSSGHEDFDFDRALEQSCLHISLRDKSSRPASTIAPKLLVGLWAIPEVVGILNAPRSEGGSLIQQSSSKERFRAILDACEDNKFLLPCLNWTVCTLFYSCHQDELRELIEYACEVAGAVRGPNAALFLPFQFLAASLQKDEAAVQAIGSHFEAAYKTVEATFGKHHPNTIVFFYYWTWFIEWHEGGQAIVEARLEKLLPLLQKTLGTHNTLTLNGMLMLAGCKMKTGPPCEAVKILRDALHHMAPSAQHMEPYRLRILHKLAWAETQEGDLRMAETHIRQVLDGRLRLFGMGHFNQAALEYVWEAITDLCEVLNGLGRHHEARETRQHYTDRFERERQEIYVNHGWRVPPAGTTWAHQEAR